MLSGVSILFRLTSQQCCPKHHPSWKIWQKRSTAPPGEQRGSTGLSTGSEFKSPGVKLVWILWMAAFVNIMLDHFYLLTMCRCSPTCMILEDATISTRGGDTTSDRCPLSLISAFCLYCSNDQMPQINSRAHWVVQGAASGTKPQCPFPDKLSVMRVLF